MQWVMFIILTWVLIILQTTVGQILSFETVSLGTIGPDLLASLAVFAVLSVRTATDAMLAACVLGIALDVTTVGAAGSVAVIGPMPIAYALAARVMFEVREAFFRERVGTQMLLTLLFCLVAHGLWVTFQSLFAYGLTTWAEYWRMILQAAAVSAYSGLLAPIMLWLFGKARRWLITAPVGRARRNRR